MKNQEIKTPTNDSANEIVTPTTNIMNETFTIELPKRVNAKYLVSPSKNPKHRLKKSHTVECVMDISELTPHDITLYMMQSLIIKRQNIDRATGNTVKTWVVPTFNERKPSDKTPTLETLKTMDVATLRETLETFKHDTTITQIVELMIMLKTK